MTTRDRDYDERYKKFRSEVIKRDKGKCQYPGCRKRTKLHVHHIHRWSDSVSLRYESSNGILICKYHHAKVTGNEYIYADMFREIVKRNSGK